MKLKNKSENVFAKILLAHGSKDPRWRKPFEQLLEKCKISSPKDIFCLSYLELCGPTLSETVIELLETHPKISTINIHPIFLSAGVHVKRDIHSILSDFKANYPQIKFILKDVIGEHSLVSNAIHKVITYEK